MQDDLSDADAQTLRRIAAGDMGGFGELVGRHKDRLFRHIRRRVRDSHRAEDLTQESFLRLFRAARAGSYKGEARVVTWLFAIAGNCVTDHLRAAARRGRTIDDLTSRRPVAEPSAELESREVSDRVARHLDELPAEQRAVVELKILDGLTFAEIAELIGCPLSTVKSRLVYALQKLKCSMRDESQRSLS
jgi:RNA polymerase sigma-70 factor (ECF subfamily)